LFQAIAPQFNNRKDQELQTTENYI